MNIERLGATSCLILALIIVLLRIPSVWRERQGRPAWFALVVGVLAFTAKGSAIPLNTLDGALGGENYVSLIQNSLAVVAFWMLFRTVKGLEQGGFTWGNPMFVIAPILSFTAPFLMIPGRRGTSEDFIDEFASHWELCAYASLYMGWVVLFAIATARAARERSARLYVLLRIGCVSVVIGSASEIVYLLTRASGLPRAGWVELLGYTFQPFFYGGVFAIALSMAGFWACRAARRIAEAAMNWATSRPSRWALPSTLASKTDRGDSTMSAFLLAASLLDTRGQDPVGVRGIAFRIIASRLFDKRIGAPVIEEIVCVPEGEL